MKNELQNCLEYCQKQNGLPYCKNCGLSQKIISSFEQAIREEIVKIGEAMKQPEEFGYYGKFDQLHIQHNIGYNKGIDDFIKKIKKDLIIN